MEEWSVCLALRRYLPLPAVNVHLVFEIHRTQERDKYHFWTLSSETHFQNHAYR
jgi:hypothetical protein